MPTKDELKAKFATGKKPTGADFALLIDGVEGPVGPAGETGKGTTGTTGTPGKDGYGTKADLDAVKARLDALEAGE